MTAILALLALAPVVELRPTTETLVLSLSDKNRQSCSIEVVNNSVEPFQFWVTSYWNNHKVSFLRSDGTDVLLTAKGVDAVRAFTAGMRDRNFPHVLAPGKRLPDRTPRLPEYFVLTPGSYTMTVTYSDLSFDLPVQLTTKKISVSVIE